MGLTADTPLLVRVNNVNRMVYLGELYSMLRFSGVEVEVLSLDLSSFTTTFRRLRGITRVEGRDLILVEFSGGSLTLSVDQRVYTINSYGFLKPMLSGELSTSHILVSINKRRPDVGRDGFNYLSFKHKSVKGEVEGVTCGSHEWIDLSPSKLKVFDALWWLLEGRERYGEGRKRGRGSERSRVYNCYSNPLRAYEISWLSRLQGYPSIVMRGGRRMCVSVVYEDGRVRDFTEKLPLEPLLKLRRAIRKSRQSEHVLHAMGHARMRFLSKRVATMAVIHLLCGGLPKGSEGVPSLILRNLVNLVFSDLVAVRVASVKRLDGRGDVYDIEVEDADTFFAGPIPILLSSRRS